MPDRGWICPKCETPVSPTENICPVCSGDKNKPDIEEIKKISDKLKEAARNGDLNRAPAPLPIPHWPNSTPKATEHPCMYDNLPPGIYGLSCTCPRCSPWCSGTNEIYLD